jgi:two-component system, NarL family, response regulator DevR
MRVDPIRVAVVDDHEVVREGIVALIEREPDMRVVGSYGSGEDLLDHVEVIRPDVVTVDYRLPGLTGSTVCRRLLKRRPGIAVLVLSSYADDAIIQACLEAGARGYLTKDSDHADLPNAIRAVARGEAVLAPEITAQVIQWSRRARESEIGDCLEMREIEVLNLVAEGMVNKRIAEKLFVSEATVKASLRGILRKLGVSRRWEAVAIGIEKGLI